MLSPVRRLLEDVRTRLFPTLVGPAAWKRLRGLADRLPLRADIYGLECRLGAGEEQVDLLCCLMAGSREQLAEQLKGLDARPVWRPIRPFLEHWCDPGSALHGSKVIWLEFDLPGAATPSVFFSVGRGGLERRLDEAFSLLRGERLPRSGYARIRRCVEALPPGGSLNHVAVMLGRDRGVRLALEVRPSHLTRYLRALGWPSPLDELARRFEARPLDVDRLGLALDMAPGGEALLGPRLGLELTFHQGLGDARWAALLAEWVAAGLCTPEKREALLRWPGCVPAGPARLVFRTLHHVKVLWEEGRPLGIKAYPAFRVLPGVLGGVFSHARPASRCDGAARPGPAAEEEGHRPDT